MRKMWILPMLLVAVMTMNANAQPWGYDHYQADMLGNEGYVEAYTADESDYNTWPTAGQVDPLGDPFTTVAQWLSGAGSGVDYGWYYKGVGNATSSKAIDGTAYQGSDNDDCPQLTTTATDILDPAKEYNIYVVYWCKNPELQSSFWYTRAALPGDPLIDCSYATADNIFFDDGGTGVQGCEVFLGTVSDTADLSIIVEAPPDTPDLDQRAWYDGISYAEVPEPATMVLLGLGGLFAMRRRK